MQNLRPNTNKVESEFQELLPFDALKKSIRCVTRSMIISLEKKRIKKSDVFY